MGPSRCPCIRALSGAFVHLMTPRGRPATKAIADRTSRYMRELQVLAAASIVTGCSSAGSGAPPADMPDSVEARLVALPAQGRSSWSGMFVDESFQLGEYLVSNVRRGGTESTSVGFNPWRKEWNTSAVFYEVGVDGFVTNGACRSTSRRATEWDGRISSKEGLGERETISSDFFECVCSTGGTETSLEISGTGPVQSVLVTFDDRTVHLKRQGTVHVADLDGAPWLAVSLSRQGGLWVDPSLDGQARAGLSCVVAGWMLR